MNSLVRSTHATIPMDNRENTTSLLDGLNRAPWSVTILSNSEGITYGWLTEEYPCYGDESECKENPANTHWQICCTDFLPTKHFLNDLEYAMENSPEHKSPIGAMPNTTYQECHEDVPVISRLGASASTQRNINIIFQPC